LDLLGVRLSMWFDLEPARESLTSHFRNKISLQK
jgi:hypothetical protein